MSIKLNQRKSKAAYEQWKLNFTVGLHMQQSGLNINLIAQGMLL